MRLPLTGAVVCTDETVKFSDLCALDSITARCICFLRTGRRHLLALDGNASTPKLVQIETGAVQVLSICTNP